MEPILMTGSGITRALREQRDHCCTYRFLVRWGGFTDDVIHAVLHHEAEIVGDSNTGFRIQRKEAS